MEQVKNTADKRARIESLQPMVKSGAIQFSKRFIILIEQQMKYFPKGPHDDGLDALEMAVRLCKQNEGGACLIYLGDVRPWRD